MNTNRRSRYEIVAEAFDPKESVRFICETKELAMSGYEVTVQMCIEDNLKRGKRYQPFRLVKLVDGANGTIIQSCSVIL